MIIENVSRKITVLINQFKVNQKLESFNSSLVLSLEKVQVWPNQIFSQFHNCRFKFRFSNFVTVVSNPGLVQSETEFEPGKKAGSRTPIQEN